MIYRDEDGDRWLACDHCLSLGRRNDTETDVEIAEWRLRDHNRFWGIGLDTNRQVRQAASDLDGFRRRKLLAAIEPDLTWIWIDLCPGCASPDSWRSIQALALIADSLSRRG